MAPSYSAENRLLECVWSHTFTTEHTELTDWILNWIQFSLYFINKTAKAPALQLVAGRHTALFNT